MDATLYVFPARISKDRSGRYMVRFRDLPEALTDAPSEARALSEARDCLSEALASRIVDGQPIPTPSHVRAQEYQVAPDPAIALKAALYGAVKEQDISTSELARRLGVDHKEARRLLDPRHPSKLPRLSRALKSLGHDVAIALYDASKRERLLTVPGNPDRKSMRIDRAVRVEAR
jgi:antitoxin HicB